MEKLVVIVPYEDYIYDVAGKSILINKERKVTFKGVNIKAHNNEDGLLIVSDTETLGVFNRHDWRYWKKIE